MGEVYRAHDTKLDRPVALKLLPHRVAADADRLHRFHAEARAASSLNHPNILVIHDFGDLDGAAVHRQRARRGSDAARRLDRGAVAVREAVAIAIQIAERAGRRAREAGSSTETSSPTTSWCTPDGYVKVLDFVAPRRRRQETVM